MDDVRRSSHGPDLAGDDEEQIGHCMIMSVAISIPSYEACSLCFTRPKVRMQSATYAAILDGVYILNHWRTERDEGLGGHRPGWASSTVSDSLIL